ncbi:MAG: 3-dehydroquinate synthase II [Marine Group II euryarchaeote MED-G35]|nr:MAG: 3-dehydroquinate synthase II [Marine Group II euryarchaeote MED-G35]
MQIWCQSSDEESSNRDVVSRFWDGFSEDVSEVQIDDPSDQEEALSLIGLVPWLLVRCSDWTMVPLENLVAASRGTSTRIAATIGEEVELNGAAFALGGGVDAILVPGHLVDDAVTILGGKWDMEETQDDGAIIEEARILSIEGAGVGERVCVDLTRRISDGQGMAVGSISGNLCLIHGETIQSDYVPTRPFRVNAGAIHSYALMADGKTKYLSELTSGDEVAILSSSGNKEKATVGRLKVETRPLILIRFEVPGSEGQIVVQQAETVRLISPSEGAISVTQAKEGDKISILTDNRARHVGFALPAEVKEK